MTRVTVWLGVRGCDVQRPPRVPGLPSHSHLSREGWLSVEGVTAPRTHPWHPRSAHARALAHGHQRNLHSYPCTHTPSGTNPQTCTPRVHTHAENATLVNRWEEKPLLLPGVQGARTHRAGHHTCQAEGLPLALHMWPEPDSVQQMPQSDPRGGGRGGSECKTGAPETRYCLSSETGPEGRRLSCVWLESCPVWGGHRRRSAQCPPTAVPCWL